MNETLPMRKGDGLGQSLDQLGGRGRYPRRAVELPIQAAARHILQLEKRQSTRFPDMVDLNNSGMLQPRDRRGLGAEPCRRDRAGVRPGQDHLERNGGSGAIFDAR